MVLRCNSEVQGKQTTNNNRQTINSNNNVKLYEWIQVGVKKRGVGMSNDFNLKHVILTAIEERKLTINTPSAGGVLTNNNRVRRLKRTE